MRKIAIFVEGQTEMIFVERFLAEYLGTQRIEIDKKKYLGKRKGIQVLGIRKNPRARFYVLIYDVGGDERVLSVMKEQAENMIGKSGYSYVLGLRDLYQKIKVDKEAVIAVFNRLFRDSPVRDRLKLILAIQEIEAWFLADYELFGRIHALATPENIKQRLNIDLAKDNPESYAHPSGTVDKIFRLFGQRYRKREEQSYQIAYKLDFVFLVCTDDILRKVTSWRYFLACIDESFSGITVPISEPAHVDLK